MTDQINIALNQLLSNNFVSSAVTLGLSFYAYKAGPELPSYVEELFENVFFQIFVGFMVLYMTTGNFMLSFVVSVVFIYGMKMFTGIKERMFGGNDQSSEFSTKDLYECSKSNSELREELMVNTNTINNEYNNATRNAQNEWYKHGREGMKSTERSAILSTKLNEASRKRSEEIKKLMDKLMKKYEDVCYKNQQSSNNQQ